MTDSTIDNDNVSFILNIEIDEDTVTCTCNIITPNEHTEERTLKILGEHKKMLEFINCVQGHHISVWSEVLPKEMTDEFKEKGIYHGISIINPIVSGMKILCIGLTQPDNQPTTKCLDIYKQTMEKVEILH